MANIRKKDFIYDVVVVGSGLTGLCSALACKRAGLEVGILEAGELPGGHARGIQTPFGVVNNGLKFIPDLASADQAIQFLNTIGVSVTAEKVDNFPKTFSTGDIKDFVGFGDHSPEFVDAISYFLTPKRIQLSQPIFEITNALVAQLNEDILTRNIVTKISELETGNLEIQINGTKSLFSKKVIFTADLQDLAGILPDSILGQRAKHKLLKADLWTFLGLDLAFKSKVSELNSMFILDGTTHDEFGPAVGLISDLEGQGEHVQFSQWIGFLSDQNSEDPEIIGTVLKKIKRQIKRAFGEAAEAVSYERIFVSEGSFGKVDLKLGPDQSLPNSPNIYIASSLLSEAGGILGAINQAELIANVMTSGLENPPEAELSLDPA